jgi:hypothetical protein
MNISKMLLVPGVLRSRPIKIRKQLLTRYNAIIMEEEKQLLISPAGSVC